MTSEQVRAAPGIPSVFRSGDVVEVPVPFEGAFRVTDLKGASVAGGATDAAGLAAGTVTLGSLPVGWYSVTWTSSTSQWATSFAVVPSTDRSRPRATELSVNVHTAVTDAAQLPLVRDVGAGALRTSMLWNEVERDGAYAYPERYTRFMAATEEAGIEPLLIVCYLHSDHDGGVALQSDEAIEAFARYAADQAKRFPAAKSIEIYNEYDWWGTTPQGGPPSDFVRLLRAAATAIRQVRPDVTIVGGSTSAPKGDPEWTWLEEIFELGGLEDLDVIAAHLYQVHAPPDGGHGCEGIEAQLDRLDALIRRYNDGEPKPIWVTETGWGTVMRPKDGPEPEVRGCAAPDTEATQAAYLVRNALLAKAWGAGQTCWYMFSDVREEIVGESYGWDFGLLRFDRSPTDGAPTNRLVPKPAFVAHAVLAEQVGGAHHLARIESGPNVRHHRFRRRDQDLDVLWSTDGTTTTVELPSARPVTVVDLMGATKQLAPSTDRVHIDVSPLPLYVTVTAAGGEDNGHR